MRNTSRVCWAALIGVALYHGSFVHAADKPAAAKAGDKDAASQPNPPIVGADADRLLKDIAGYLKAAREFSFHA